MKLRCVKKLVLQRIGCWNLGRNGGLWCWEFQRKWELGSVVVSGCSGGKCWDGFGRGRKGEDAGGLGEIGGRIRRDLEGVLGSEL